MATEVAKTTSLRPSRDEREPYISAINTALSEGRIHEPEASTRIDRAEAAISFDDLDELVGDIPFEWREESASQPQTRGRRRFLLGSLGLLGVGVAAWGGTRAWETMTESKTDTGTGDPSAPSGGDANGESVPIDRVQVYNWRKDTMPTAVDYAASVGLTTIGRVFGSGDGFSVQGADAKGQWMRVDFTKDARPRLTKEREYGSSDNWLEPADLRNVDVSGLYRKVKSKLAVNQESHQLDIGYDQTAKWWLITISDGSAGFSWTLKGLKIYKT